MWLMWGTHLDACFPGLAKSGVLSQGLLRVARLNTMRHQWCNPVTRHMRSFIYSALAEPEVAQGVGYCRDAETKCGGMV